MLTQTKAEISTSLKVLKNGKTPGLGGIPPKALKANPKTDMMHQLFLKHEKWIRSQTAKERWLGNDTHFENILQ